MKLATIDAGADGHVGVLTGDGDILDVAMMRASSARAAVVPGSLRGVLAAGDDGLDAARRCLGEVESMTTDETDRLRETGALRPFDDTRLLATIPDPRLILSAGMNYGVTCAR